MAISYRAFLIELYEEYLEEASFLYAQRLALYPDPEITWIKIGEFEERLEAHIDGLIVGDKLALDVCAKHATEGDFGELFAAVSVFCRQNRQDLILRTFETLDFEDTEKVTAIADALKYEMPQAWVPDFLVLLESGDPKLAPILAPAFGYRRAPIGPQMLTAIKRCPAKALPSVVWAAGRIDYRPTKEPLLDYLHSQDEPTKAASALALARMGELLAADDCLTNSKSESWPLKLLALAGGRDALSALTQIDQAPHQPERFRALGLLGDPVSVPILLAGLAGEAAPEAALALYAITGAHLVEKVFVPDEVDEDELFESEKEQWKQTKIIDRGDGRPFGTNVTRICQDPEIWEEWWNAHSDDYAVGVRYRNGRPLSPAAILDMLNAEHTPYLIRWACLEELAIRYGHDAGFEVDSSVVSQKRGLTKAAEWVRSQGTWFHEGASYFAGQAQHWK